MSFALATDVPLQTPRNPREVYAAERRCDDATMSGARGERLVLLAAAAVAALGACNALVGNEDVSYIASDAAAPPADARAEDAPPILDAAAADSGALVALATEGDAGVGKVAVDGTHVYWAVEDVGQVKRMPKGGGAVETFTAAQGAVTDFAVGAAEVFVNGYGYGTSPDYKGSGAERLPFGGGAAYLPMGCPVTRFTTGVAFADPHVFYGVFNCNGDVAAGLTLVRASKADSYTAATASLPDAGLYQPVAPSAVIAVDANDVFMTVAGILVRVAPDLSAVRGTAGPFAQALAIALEPDGSAVYLREPTALRRLVRDTFAPSRLVPIDGAVSFQSEQRAQIAVNDTVVYFSATTGLFRMSKATFAPEKVLPGPVAGVALDPTHLYFSSGSTLYRIGL